MTLMRDAANEIAVRRSFTAVFEKKSINPPILPAR